jgi:pimeloyl-ACP methyl ester carboxylesterase
MIACSHPGPTIAVAILFLAGVATAQTTLPWRYDLRPGDHLTYSYTFQRRIQSKEEQSQVQARFHTHLLVIGWSGEHLSLGFQRNREAAEITEYLSKGKDRLAHELPDFQRRMQRRPSHFSEAMEISQTGEARYAWEIARESSLRLLDTLHEVVNLPPGPLMKGEAWRSELGLDLRWLGDESIHGKLCHRLEGKLPDQSLKLSYWWSPESGVIEQLTLDDTYLDHDTTTHETARMELESRARGEPLEKWLGSVDTRLAALQAILLTPVVPISAGQISPVLNSEDPAAQALALAIASQRKIEVPNSILSKLRQTGSDQVKLLANSLSNFVTPQRDECGRALPAKLQPAKFGTAAEVARAAKDSPEIQYMLRVPLSYSAARPAPLLVYLSGGAGFAIDGVNSAEDIIAGTDYLVLYPEAAGYWWKPDVASRFDTVLNDVLQRYNVDRDRIYLVGFSNGGTGALYFATVWPQRFAAVVSLMGAGQCNDQVKAGLTNLKNLPLLFVHGENDPRITPDCSTTTHAVLSEMHPAIKPEIKILPGRAHDITLESDDGLTLAFLKNKLRNPFPHEVDITVLDGLAARAYWLEILDGKPGKSSAEARVKTDNAIEIRSHDVKSIRLHLRPELLAKTGDIRIIWNGKRIFSGPLREVCSLPSPSQSEDPKLDQTDRREFALP